MYHSTSVNGKTLTNRPQSASIRLFAGQADDQSKGSDYWHAVQDTVWLAGSRTRLDFTMRVEDDDGAINPPDLVADRTWSETAPNITTGLGLYVTEAYNGCSTRFYYDVVKEADIFAPPVPAAPLTLSARH